MYIIHILGGTNRTVDQGINLKTKAKFQNLSSGLRIDILGKELF